MKILLEASRDKLDKYLPKDGSGKLSAVTVQALEDAESAKQVYIDMISQWVEKEFKSLDVYTQDVLLQSIMEHGYNEKSNPIVAWLLSAEEAEVDAAGHEGVEQVYRMVQSKVLKTPHVKKYFFGTNLFEKGHAVYKLKILEQFLNGDNKYYKNDDGDSVEIEDIFVSGKFLPAAEIREILDQFVEDDSDDIEEGTVETYLSNVKVDKTDKPKVKDHFLKLLTHTQTKKELKNMYGYTATLSPADVSNKLDELISDATKYNKFIKVDIQDVSSQDSVAYAVYKHLDGVKDDFSRPGKFIAWKWFEQNKRVIKYKAPQPDAFKLTHFKVFVKSVLPSIKDTAIASNLPAIKTSIDDGSYDSVLNTLMNNHYSVKNNLHTELLRAIVTEIKEELGA